VTLFVSKSGFGCLLLLTLISIYILSLIAITLLQLAHSTLNTRFEMARTKQTAKLSTGGPAKRVSLSLSVSRPPGPVPGNISASAGRPAAGQSGQPGQPLNLRVSFCHRESVKYSLLFIALLYVPGRWHVVGVQ
jgi:hypothetical protein